MHTKPTALAAFLVGYAASAFAQQGEWAQCGIGWGGGTQCVSGTVCTQLNPYYFQCLPPSQGATTVGGQSTTSRAMSTTTRSPTSVVPPPTTSDTTTTTSVNNGGGGTGNGNTQPGKLNTKFVSHGKKFWGSAADSGTINIAANQALLKSDFGGVTPENSMKWDATENTRNVFTFSGADALVSWAQSNGKIIRGHNLVWHSQLPSWVSAIGDAPTLTSVIQNHISHVAGRYAGQLYAWDVTNEILNEDGTLRTSVFYTVLGQNFVNIAFTAARQADSTAKLYINDYNLDSNNAKTQGMVKLVKAINQNTHLIDGIGTQMHLSAGGAGGAQAALTALAGVGNVEVAITELDIAGAAPNDYVTVVKACLATAACVSITSWGVADVNSWRASSTPLLFNTNYQPKPAYSSVLAAM